jgi:hypothetical protein
LAKLGKASPRSPSATSELTSMKEGEAASKKVKCFSSVVCCVAVRVHVVSWETLGFLGDLGGPRWAGYLLWRG